MFSWQSFIPLKVTRKERSCSTRLHFQFDCLLFVSSRLSAAVLGLKKKDACLPFSDDPKFWKTWVAFCFCFCLFVCLFVFIFKFAFLNKIVEIIIFKMHFTLPKVNCVGTEGLFGHPIYVSTRLFNVTYLNTENYMIYIAFLQHPDLLNKKKKIDLPTIPIFRPKRQTNLYLFTILGLIWASHFTYHLCWLFVFLLKRFYSPTQIYSN